MFNKKKYYNYSSIIENISIFIFILYCGVLITIGAYFWGIKGILIGLLIGFITGYIPYMFIQIKVQEMRMKIEIHTSLTQNKN